MKKFAIMALAATCGSAFAFDLSFNLPSQSAIADGGSTPSANSPGTPLVITMTVSGTGETVTGFSLAGILNLTHTFVGDLTAVLSHAGVSVDLMDRDYRTTAAGFGNSSNFLNADIMFNDTLNGTVNTAGAFSGTDATNNPSGTYNRWNNPSLGSSTAANSFGNFVGTSLDGTWTLTLTDWAAADTGAAEGLRIVGTSNAVPEPASIAALGLGIAALVRRRNRK